MNDHYLVHQMIEGPGTCVFSAFKAKELNKRAGKLMRMSGAVVDFPETRDCTIQLRIMQNVAPSKLNTSHNIRLTGIICFAQAFDKILQEAQSSHHQLSIDSDNEELFDLRSLNRQDSPQAH